MKYKMICIDMDGTLLNSKKVVSEENRIALKKARAAEPTLTRPAAGGILYLTYKREVK